MTEDDVLAAEERFFDALVRADGGALEGALTADFLIIDVMTGSEAPGAALVSLLGSGQLRARPWPCRRSRSPSRSVATGTIMSSIWKGSALRRHRRDGVPESCMRWQ